MTHQQDVPGPTADQQAAVAEFRRLHASGTFVIPNPWDAGSARVMEHLGFPALASSSSAASWTTGHPDNGLGLDLVLEHLRTLTAAVSIPVNADFEGGYATEPAQVHAHVLLATGTGIAGLSIEDSTQDPDEPLLDAGLALERVVAARRAIDESGTGVLLTARSEGFIVGRPDLDETVRRLQSYAEAGADCLYAPGIRTTEQIAAVVGAVAPLPVNLLVNAPFITVPEAAGLGVRRISVGGTLARTAWGGWLAAAREITEAGTFTHFQDLPDVEGILREGR